MQLFGSVLPLPLSDLRLMVLADETNPKTKDLAAMLEPHINQKPNLIAVIGGDGFMLRMIRRFWHKRLPFFGINAGHRGFLLNEPAVLKENFPPLNIYHLPLLDVEVYGASGKTKRLMAFNDVWVERVKSQTAWVEVKVDGVVRLPKLVADAAIISTPSGSTAYAMAMGASPLPLDAQALVLAGSNVCDPLGFKPCYLPLSSRVEFTTLNADKRPLYGVIDGVRQGQVARLKVAVSQTASVQLAFAESHSLTEKLAGIQFLKKD